MAQANAMQREPSMEEILASIRRIIEDSDQPKPSANDDAPQPTAGRITSPTAEDADPDEAAFRTELRDQPATDRAQPARPAPAQVAEPARPAASVSPLRPAEIAPPAAARAEPAARPAPEVEHAHRHPVAADEAPEAQAVSSAAPVQRPVEPARPSIISEQAGRQVAAAFGELSDAFAASRRRSFDEMAEEMMRPLLQEWMDNNLPHLVERLVREEIERIARG